MTAKTPPPPYYAVIFTAERTDMETGYSQTAERMRELATTQPGFLGIEWEGDKSEITVSYWQSSEAIINWKKNYEHEMAQSRGKSTWYKNYKVRVCKVERDYEFNR